MVSKKQASSLHTWNLKGHLASEHDFGIKQTRLLPFIKPCLLPPPNVKQTSSFSSQFPPELVLLNERKDDAMSLYKEGSHHWLPNKWSHSPAMVRRGGSWDLLQKMQPCKHALSWNLVSSNQFALSYMDKDEDLPQNDSCAFRDLKKIPHHELYNFRF